MGVETDRAARAVSAGAPTDPNVCNSRIRFLKLSIRYATAHGVDRVQIRQGMACQNRRNQAQEARHARRRRMSHFRQTLSTSWRKRASAGLLPVIP